MPEETAVPEDQRQISPGGRYRITFYEREVFNTHWVRTPTITDQQTGDVVLALTDTQWGLDEWRWLTGAVVEFTMRKYPGNHSPADLTLKIDCDNRTGAIGAAVPVPLASLESEMEKALTWIYATPAAPPAGIRAALRRIFKGG